MWIISRRSPLRVAAGPSVRGISVCAMHASASCMVDTHQLVVQHCPGEYQRGDLLTKALPSARLAELRDLVGLVQEELARDGALQPYGRGSNFRQVGVTDLLTLIDTLRERAAQGAGEHRRALHDLRAYASCPSTRSTLSPTYQVLPQNVAFRHGLGEF